MAKKILSFPIFDQFFSSFSNTYTIKCIKEFGFVEEFKINFDYSDKSDSEFKTLISNHFDNLLTFSSNEYIFTEFFINYTKKSLNIYFQKWESYTTDNLSITNLKNINVFKDFFLNYKAPQKSIQFTYRVKRSKPQFWIHFDDDQLDQKNYITKKAEIINKINTINSEPFTLSGIFPYYTYKYIALRWGI